MSYPSRWPLSLNERYRGYVLSYWPSGMIEVHLHGHPVYLATDPASARLWVDMDMKIREETGH